MKKKTSVFAVLLALVLLIASFTTMATAFADESETDVFETVHGQNDLEGEEGDGQRTILETGPDPPENLEVEHCRIIEKEEFLYPVEEIETDNLEGEIGYLQHDPESDDAYDNWYESIEIDETELHVGMDAPAEEADGEQTIGVLLRRTDNSDRTPEVTIEMYQDGTHIDTLAEELEIDDPEGEVHYFNFDAADLVDPSGEGVTIELSAPRTGGAPGDRNAAEYGAVEWQATTLGESDGTEDNLLTWDASPNDSDDVIQYNVSRSEEEDGEYDNIATVDADGSPEYEFVDEDAGTADDILWWYKVHALDDQDQESVSAGPVLEPGPFPPTDPEPEDGATEVGPEEVELSVYVEHSEGNTTDNVTFYDASDDSVIGSVEDVDNDTRTENITWDGLEPDQTYEWYVEAEDPGGTVQSETWEFTTDEIEVSEVVIDPAEDQVVQAGDELNFTAEAFDELGNLITDNVTDFTWYNISEVDGEENVTIFSEEDTGEYDVTAEYEDVSNSTTVTVEPADPAYIVIEPEEYTVVTGEEVNYTSTAYD